MTGTLRRPTARLGSASLAKAEQRVLVCTDCLSEGINLQDAFDAVVHYDLSWNPTRHEQREGRVDRYGQESKVVRVVTYYGTDNRIDGAVLEVLLRKHQKIRSALGISVPVPANTEKVMEALLHGALLRGDATQLTLDIGDPEKNEVHGEWEIAGDREKMSRTLFAQHTIKPEEVFGELKAVRDTLGAGVEVEQFVRETLSGHGAVVADAPKDAIRVELDEVPAALKDAIGRQDQESRTTAPEVRAACGPRRDLLAPDASVGRGAGQLRRRFIARSGAVAEKHREANGRDPNTCGRP